MRWIGWSKLWLGNLLVRAHFGRKCGVRFSGQKSPCLLSESPKLAIRLNYHKKAQCVRSRAMSKLNPSIAIGDYDRTHPLTDGKVQIAGIDPTFLFLEPEEIFFRSFRHVEFDICEISLSSFAIKSAAGNCPYVGVPVFPSRAFRHSSIYIRTDRSIHPPAGLKGKRVGVPEYQLTANVWVRMCPRPIGSEQREKAIQSMTIGLVASYRYFRHHGKSNASVRRPESQYTTIKIGRNDPCPCGSGRKYKRCCRGATIH